MKNALQFLFFVGCYIQSSLVLSQQDIRTFIFGHSLIHHEFQVNPTPSDETSVPHWFQLLADEGGHSYAVGGQYGFLLQHANVPPIPNWGFDIVEGAWDSDIESFADAAFTNILITPGNFIQDQAPSKNYYNSSTSPLDATEIIINWCMNQKSDLTYYIYENWPDMGPFLANDFPPTAPSASEWQNYNTYLKGAFHDWFIAYHDALKAAFPEAPIKMIPVGPIISDLLALSPYENIAIDTLYEDNAPHGRPTIYFLAGLITYMAMYQEIAPPNYVVSDFIDPIIRNNYNAVVNFIWDELYEYNDANGLSRVFTNDISTSVPNISLEADAIELYPNPSSNQFEISGILQNYNLEIIDINGVVHQILDNTEASIAVDISSLPSGLYFIHISSLQNQLLCIKSIIKE